MKAFWVWIVKAAQDVYSFAYAEIGRVLAVLKDPAGKFSHKRLIALAFTVVSIFLLFQHEWWGAGIADVVVAVLAAISAITKT